MFGGYYSFQGINGGARYHKTPVEEVLPVSCLPVDDRVEVPEGFAPVLIGSPSHPILKGLGHDWPVLLGFNEVTVKDGAEVLATVSARLRSPAAAGDRQIWQGPHRGLDLRCRPALAAAGASSPGAATGRCSSRCWAGRPAERLSHARPCRRQCLHRHDVSARPLSAAGRDVERHRPCRRISAARARTRRWPRRAPARGVRLLAAIGNGRGRAHGSAERLAAEGIDDRQADRRCDCPSDRSTIMVDARRREHHRQRRRLRRRASIPLHDTRSARRSSRGDIAGDAGQSATRDRDDACLRRGARQRRRHDRSSIRARSCRALHRPLARQPGRGQCRRGERMTGAGDMPAAAAELLRQRRRHRRRDARRRAAAWLADGGATARLDRGARGRRWSTPAVPATVFCGCSPGCSPRRRDRHGSCRARASQAAAIRRDAAGHVLSSCPDTGGDEAILIESDRGGTSMTKTPKSVGQATAATPSSQTSSAGPRW